MEEPAGAPVSTARSNAISEEDGALLDYGKGEATGEGQTMQTSTSYRPHAFLHATLMFLVIAFGCADVVLRQIVAKTLSRFSYMLSLVTASAYAPLYLGVLLILLKFGVVPMRQVQWTWSGWRTLIPSMRHGISSAPYVKLFVVAALGDSVGNVFGYICTPYVSGPVHSLLAQFTIMFTATLSMCIMRKTYSLAQIVGLIGVEVVVIIGVIPNLGKGGSSSDPFFSFLLGFSCLFNALAWVLKEMSFTAYKSFTQMKELAGYEKMMNVWPTGILSPRVPSMEHAGDLMDPMDSRTWASDKDAVPLKEDTLHIFIVNSHTSLFQLPLTLLLVPLAYVTGQTKGEDVFTYLHEGFGCLAGVLDENPLCAYAGQYTVLYVVCNICWNCVILLNVKFNGALSTFVALKAISPCSAVLFALVDWPLLHTTSLRPVTWFVFLIMMPFIIFYVWASNNHRKREEEDPASATCCWPIWQAPPPASSRQAAAM
jgi:hypothetical protein